MKISFLIVTRNRTEDLIFTLKKLKPILDLSVHEVLIFIDGCKKTEAIVKEFNWVNWTISEKTISASPSRNILYKKAKGHIFIGLDDDAHPISENFISSVEKEFKKDKKIGIIAFQEVRGIYESDKRALEDAKQKEEFYTNDFVGCGFAIKKEVYDATNGFPVWMDIYGEESAVAFEVLDLEYQIIYQPSIVVNHRVDKVKRKKQGRNYYRFERQLKNAIKFYLIYYPKPILRIIKLLWHNFKKYAVTDFKHFMLFFKTCFLILFQIFSILKYRKPVKKSTWQTRLQLKDLKY